MKSLFLIFFILSGTAFSADTVYVSKSGGNIYPFNSWTTASQTIQLAVNSAVDGDVILIDEGTYIEKVFSDKMLTFEGVSRENCIIDITEISHVDSFDYCFEIEADCNFNNLTIINDYQTNLLDFGIFSIVQNLTVTNCNFENGACIGTIDGNLYADNLIIRNAYYGLSIHSTGVDTAWTIIENSQVYSRKDCIRGYGGNFIIRNNILGGDSLASFAVRHMISYESMIFENNIVTGINRVCIRDNHHLYESIVRNNLFYNCWDENDFEYVLEVVFAPNKTFENNIILNCAGGINHYNPDTMYTNHNLFWNVKRYLYGNVKLGDREIFANPMFVDINPSPLESNFQVQKYSPAINTGNPEIFDVDGTLSDIGPKGGPNGVSYEYLDLPPKPVILKSIEFDYETTLVKMDWEDNSEADIKGYWIHKGRSIDFIPKIYNRIGFADTSGFNFVMLDEEDKTYYYKIKAVDKQGNLGDHDSYFYLEINLDKLTEKEGIGREHEYELKQNYPNPFNPETRISYQLKEASNVFLEILDIKGERVDMLAEGLQSAGEHSVVFDGAKLASGVYIYRLQVKDEKGKIIYSQGNKMLLLK